MKTQSFFHELIETLRVSLDKLNEIQFSAPWNPRQRAR